MPTRQATIQAIRKALLRDLRVLRDAARSARDEATHEDTKQEGKYDTRAIEAGYLAHGQSRRIAEIEASIERFSRVAETVASTKKVSGPSLVELEDANGETRWFFVGPAGGGLSVEVEGTKVRVLTPGSPLGKALVGAEIDDEIVVVSTGASYELISIR